MGDVHGCKENIQEGLIHELKANATGERMLDGRDRLLLRDEFLLKRQEREPTSACEHGRRARWKYGTNRVLEVDLLPHPLESFLELPDFLILRR
jgi:hypothetical protein